MTFNANLSLENSGANLQGGINNENLDENIKFLDLPQLLKSESTLIIDDLNLLKNEILAKKEDILQRTNKIKDRVDQLEGFYPGIREKSKISELFDSTTKDYIRLIDVTANEIDALINISKTFLTPYKVKAQAPVEIVYAYVYNELKSIKKFLKTRRKELAVFFSRYDHGYNMHMLNINKLYNQYIYLANKAAQTQAKTK